MQLPDPSRLAALLVEEHGEDAYARSVAALVDRQKTGDRAGERLYLQVVKIVKKMLQKPVLLRGQIPDHVPPSRLYPIPPNLDLPNPVEDPSDGIPVPADPPSPTLH